MVKALINGIFNLILHLLEIVLFPLNTLIMGLIPGLSEVLSYIEGFFNYLKPFGPFVISYTGLTPTLVGVMTSLVVATFTITLSVTTIKLIVSWYNALKF